MTHNVQVLKKVDYIVVLKEGKISEQGTYQQLIDNEGHFSNFLLQYMIEECQKEEEHCDVDDLKEPENTVLRQTSFNEVSEEFSSFPTEEFYLQRNGSIRSKSSIHRYIDKELGSLCIRNNNVSLNLYLTFIISFPFIQKRYYE